MLGGKVRFTKLPTGNYIQATRVEKSAQPRAMVAPVIRPGRAKSMNTNDLHRALSHANEATTRGTAKQM